MWHIHLSNRFRKDYKNLRVDLQKRVEEIIKQLRVMEDPTAVHKTARYNCLNSYEIGRQYRILYDIDYKNGAIRFLRVGIHKIY